MENLNETISQLLADVGLEFKPSSEKGTVWMQAYSMKYRNVWILGYILGWILSNANQNCDDACDGRGLICSEEDQFKHNSDVDSCSKIEKLVHKIIGTKNSIKCNVDHGIHKDVPNCDQQMKRCHTSVPARILSTFNCTEFPVPEYANKRRLCYCNDNQ